MPYTNLYKRSIYIEVYDIDSNGQAQNLQQSFAFPLPPQNISITQKQRHTVTETPGGNFIDEYGIGNAVISISGDTGNYEKRLTILGPGKTPRYLTGQEAWFEFQSRIERYSASNEEFIMYFYDLTHKGSVDIFSDTSSLGKYSESWEVVLDNSVSNRTSAKPFFYPYSLNFIGVRRLGSYDASGATNKISFISDITDTINNVTENIDNLRAELDVFLANALEYVEEITSIFNTISSLTNSIASFSDLFLDYENKLAGLFGEVISESEDILTSGVKIITFPSDALQTAQDNIDSLSEQMEDLITAAKDAGYAVVDAYDWDENNDPVSSLSEIMYETQKDFNELKLFEKQSASYDPIGGVAIDGVVTQLYGYTTYTAKENTRLDRLANELFGDPDVKDIISAINDVYSNDEITSGDTLKIPVLQANVRYANNAVYNSESTVNEILGRDITIDSSGVIITQGNDYLVTTEEETVLQAVQNKLAETKGRQVRDSSYGVLTEIGEALDGDAPLELIKIGLEETLLQDPRITEVYNQEFILDGDKVYQTFQFDTITKEALTYTGDV